MARVFQGHSNLVFLSRSGLVASLFLRGKCAFMALGCNIAWWA